MEIEFLGAAQTVTGSMHLVRTSRANVLLDCGLFQGHRRESFERNRNLPVDAEQVDAVVLSHAHIDHSGALPLLVKRGYRGPIYTTPATRDLCVAMLNDAAMVQDSDARFINHAIEHDRADMDPVEPLYDTEDVLRTLACFVGVPYGQAHSVAPGVTLTFLDAGHVLGSSICVLDLEERERTRRVVFTGDLGRRNMPILRDPEIPSGTEVLLCESTYGDRLHDPIARMDDALAEALQHTYDRRGKVVIPSFALERAQELVLAFKRLQRAGRLPPMRIYVDSPLAVKLTEVFRRHPECYDRETRAMVLGHDPPFALEGLHYVSSVEESKAIDASPEPLVVVSGSGMAEGGRVLHHLRATVEDQRNTIIIVGFQAQHTLGRRLVERRPRVRIFGVERDRYAEVVVLSGFSAHADQRDLIEFIQAVRHNGKLETVALIHGEPPAQAVLQKRLGEAGFADVRIPAPRDRLVL
jgi:metallo-beta-lactamase family protein